MESKLIIIKLLENFTEQVDKLSESDLLKIKAETHEITIQIKKKKSTLGNKELLTDERKRSILKELQNHGTREDGLVFLSSNDLNKKELEQLAKSLDILILRQDKVEQIKDKIIEATIGAVLRSNAIQGKKHNK